MPRSKKGSVNRRGFLKGAAAGAAARVAQSSVVQPAAGQAAQAAQTRATTPLPNAALVYAYLKSMPAAKAPRNIPLLEQAR